MCPNFGRPALTPSYAKYKCLQVENIFATIVNELSVLKLFQLSNGDLTAHTIYNVREPRMTKSGQGVKVMAHYPILVFSRNLFKLNFDPSYPHREP